MAKDKSKDRITRVNELLFRELGSVLTVELGQELPYMVTVTGVECSPNLRDAIVYVSVFGNQEKRGKMIRDALKLLERRRAAIQAAVARKVILKYTPVLHFRNDDTAEKADRVEAILRDLNLGDGNPDTPPEPPRQDAGTKPAPPMSTPDKE